MPFGLTNAPSYFCRVMEKIFAEVLYDFVLVYIDDILIFSSSFTEQHLDFVLKRLHHFNVKLKLKKCEFGKHECVFLGFLLDGKRVKPNPAKVEAVPGISVPRNVKELISFLGMVSYFRRFIPNFSDRVEPLQMLIKKTLKFEWSHECDASFFP
jgi:hypothetical protein